MLRLHRGGSDVAVVSRRLLHCSRPRRYSARSAVKAGVVVDHRAVVVDDRRVVVGIVNDGRVRGIHVGHRAVVLIHVTAPPAADETDTTVATPVINTAVESNVRAPVAGIPDIEAFSPTPIARGPQHANYRRLNPGSGNPVVAVLPVRPISGLPNVAGIGWRRLQVHRQRRWSDTN